MTGDDKPRHWILTIPVAMALVVAFSAGMTVMALNALRAATDKLAQSFGDYAKANDVRVRAIEDRVLVHETKTADAAIVHAEIRHSKRDP